MTGGNMTHGGMDQRDIIKEAMAAGIKIKSPLWSQGTFTSLYFLYAISYIPKSSTCFVQFAAWHISNQQASRFCHNQ